MILIWNVIRRGAKQVKKKIVSLIAIVTTIYQVLIGYFGAPPSLQHRPLSVGIVLFLLFVTVNVKGEKGKRGRRLLGMTGYLGY